MNKRETPEQRQRRLAREWDRVFDDLESSKALRGEIMRKVFADSKPT